MNEDMVGPDSLGGSIQEWAELKTEIAALKRDHTLVSELYISTTEQLHVLEQEIPVLRDQNAALSAMVQALETELERVRPSVPLETFLGPCRPCPFCGKTESLEVDDEFMVYCDRCGATAPNSSWQFRPLEDSTPALDLSAHDEALTAQLAASRASEARAFQIIEDMGKGELWPDTVGPSTKSWFFRWSMTNLRQAQDSSTALDWLKAHDEAVRRDALEQLDNWHEGFPPHPYDKEWFIAETTYGDRVVLVALPETYAYDFKTADETFIKKEFIRKWRQFPDSGYKPFGIPPSTETPTQEPE